MRATCTSTKLATAAAKNANVVLPVRTTFYGAKEIGLKDPAGHVVVFAEMAEQQP